ncbi:hypothetical protein FACS189451_09120 [Bacteroidia bacterium]|nr:hypothetical protein FACS189451_09120 [Bacteroidia bacterium]
MPFDRKTKEIVSHSVGVKLIPYRVSKDVRLSKILFGKLVLLRSKAMQNAVLKSEPIRSQTIFIDL